MSSEGLIENVISLRKLGQFQKALGLLESHLENLEDGQVEIRVAYLNEQSQCLWRIGKLTESESRALEALHLASEYSKNGQCDALNNLGAISLERNDLRKAREFYQQSQKLGERINNNKIVADSLNGLGIVAEENGKLDKAKALYKQSLKLREKNGDLYDISISLNNLGEIYRQRGELDQAEEYYQRCLGISQNFGNPQEIATDMHNLALIFSKRGQFKRAIDMHKESLNLYHKVGNPREEAHSRYYLIRNLLLLNMNEEATKQLNELAKLCEESEISNASVYFNLATGLIKLKNVDLASALNATLKASEIAKQIPLFESQVESMQLLIQIYLQMYLLLRQSDYKKLIETLLIELETLCKQKRLHGPYIETLIVQGFLRRAKFDLSGAISQFNSAELLAEERGFVPLAKKARTQLTQLKEEAEKLKQLMFVSPKAYEQAQLQEMASYLHEAQMHLLKQVDSE